ncbi:MAG: histidine phosphatase family protein [Thermoprotei archaeon]|jgi:probable phosphoglycerate mutase
MIAYMVRHGEAENNVSGVFPDDEKVSYHLTQVGRDQARAVSSWLGRAKPLLIVSSPVTRARETAEIISAELGIPLKLDERLREAKLGSLVGMDYNEFSRQDPNWYEDYFSEGSKYGIEKFHSIRSRMISAITEQWGSGPVVFVSHLEPIRSVVSIALGMSGPSVRKIRIFNGSITTVSVNAPEIDVVSLNCLP